MIQLLFRLLFLALAAPFLLYSQGDRPPNVILILADDLGYGDLSCYGQDLFQTPRIDQLAQTGVKFTQHYAGSSICSPSRCSLLTGRSPGYAAIRGNIGLPGTEEAALPSSEVTIAELLKSRGYATGCFGKWGLGSPSSEGNPLDQGFDRFFGYANQFAAHDHYPTELWSDGETVRVPQNQNKRKGIYAPRLIQDKALEFIEQHQSEPFFCYIPTTLPHASLVAPEPQMERFRGKFEPEIPFRGEVAAMGLRLGIYTPQPEPHAAYAAMVAEIDSYVGQIVELVERLGLADNTIIIFTSDNGPHDEGGGDPRYFDSTGGLRGIKRDLYEGGIRVPFIASWPGHFAAGQSSNHLSASWDIMATLAKATGTVAPAKTEGISFLPTLLGRGRQPQHEALFWEMHEGGGKMALRKNNWKAVRLNVDTRPNAPVELYDLAKDPSETINLAPVYPSLAAEMKDSMESYRTRSATFPFPYENVASNAGKTLPRLVAVLFALIVIGSLLRYFRQPFVVAYLLGGIAVGPSGFDLFPDIAILSQLGDLALIILLFFVGLSLPRSDLSIHWRTTAPGICVQILASVAVVVAIGSLVNWPLSRSVLLGFVICISSTTIISGILQDGKAANTLVGKSALGISIGQDIAVIPMIIVLQLFGDAHHLGGAPVWLRILGGVALFSLIAYRLRARPIRFPISQRLLKDHEMQIFFALGICFGFASISAALGLSVATGAFVGGILIATNNEISWIRTNLASFRSVFLSLFFIAIGAIIDLRFVADNWFYVSILTIAVLSVNTSTNYVTLRLLGRRSRESWIAAAMLSQIGEFAFALTALGLADGIIGEFGYQIAISVISLTLLVSPIWIYTIKRLTRIDDLSNLA